MELIIAFPYMRRIIFFLNRKLPEHLLPDVSRYFFLPAGGRLFVEIPSVLQVLHYSLMPDMIEGPCNVENN